MGYTWIPSGATPAFLQWHLWVREGKGGRIEHRLDAGSMIHDPSVQAARLKEGFTLRRIGPYFHHDTILRHHSEWWMASAHHLKPEEGRFAADAGVKMLCDSGGWQIKSGASDYVDPHKVIEVYNACADAGMALDYPPRRDVDTTSEVFRILAKIQKGHNAIFLAKRREGLELINVAHGVTGDQWRAWIESVNVPDGFQGWAISEDSDADPHCMLRGAAVLYRDFGVRDQRVHLFGISGPLQIPVAAWLGRFFPNLTSDSSSWQGGRFGSYLYNSHGALRTLKIGRKSPEVADGIELHDYCQCEFCSVLGTFGAYRAKGAYPALSAHSVIAIQSSVALWNDLATKVDRAEYEREIRDRFSYPGHKRKVDRPAKIIRQLDYLEEAMAKGPEAADRLMAKSRGLKGVA